MEKEKIKNTSPEPVSFEGTEIILNQMNKCVCKIYNKGEGTGFFTKIPFSFKQNKHKKIQLGNIYPSCITHPICSSSQYLFFSNSNFKLYPSNIANISDNCNISYSFCFSSIFNKRSNRRLFKRKIR